MIFCKKLGIKAKYTMRFILILPHTHQFTYRQTVNYLSVLF